MTHWSNPEKWGEIVCNFLPCALNSSRITHKNPALPSVLELWRWILSTTLTLQVYLSFRGERSTTSAHRITLCQYLHHWKLVYVCRRGVESLENLFLSLSVSETKAFWNKPRSCLVEMYLCSEQFLQSLIYLIQFSKAQIPKLFSVTWNGTVKQWQLYALASYHVLATVPCRNNLIMKTEGAMSSFNYSKLYIYVKNICFFFLQ